MQTWAPTLRKYRDVRYLRKLGKENNRKFKDA